MAPPKPPPSREFADLLTQIRLHANKKQLYIATMVGCSKQNVSQVERARQHPSAEIISAYLQLTERGNDMERRNLLVAAAAGLGLVAVPDQALAQAWDQAMAEPDALHELTVQRGAEIITAAPDTMRQRLTGDLLAATTGGGKHRWDQQARLMFFYARTGASNAAAWDDYQRALAAAERSGDADTIAWTHANVALSTCYEREYDPETKASARQALAYAGPTETGGVAAVKANLALMHLAVAAGGGTEADAYRDAAMRAAERIDLRAPRGNALAFSEEALLSSVAFATAKRGDRTGLEHWARQARQAGTSGRLNEHLALYAAVAARVTGEPDAADTARAVLNGLGTPPPMSLRTLAVQAGASEYAV